MPFCTPNEQCLSTEGKNVLLHLYHILILIIAHCHYYDVLTCFVSPVFLFVSLCVFPFFDVLWFCVWSNNNSEIIHIAFSSMILLLHSTV